MRNAVQFRDMFLSLSYCVSLDSAEFPSFLDCVAKAFVCTFITTSLIYCSMSNSERHYSCLRIMLLNESCGILSLPEFCPRTMQGLEGPSEEHFQGEGELGAGKRCRQHWAE